MQRLETRFHDTRKLLRYHQDVSIPYTGFPVAERVKGTEDVLLKIDSVLERPTENAGTGMWISYFDKYWKQEKLPQDWYNLRGQKSEVGFSMRSQLNLLEHPGNVEQITKWTQQTKQDLIGFKLEYLSNHLVYPCKYTRSTSDQTRFESKEYGNKDMEETVSSKERNGSVKAAVKEIKDFFQSAPDGSLAVMISPEGDSGLRTDEGERIEYPDSYFFIMQKNGDTVTNYTVKTDFSVNECRDAVYRLTGKRLSPTAPLEQYVRAIATMKLGQKETISSVSDVVHVLETIRPAHAFEEPPTKRKFSWEEIYRDIEQGEKLYHFNDKTRQIIKDFEEYCLGGQHPKDELQKAMAATILRMSKLFYEEEDARPQKSMKPNVWEQLFRAPRSFGAVLEQVSQKPGCAGGGKRISISILGGERSAVIGGVSDNEFVCPKCGYHTRESVGNTCPKLKGGCGLTKEEYALETGVSCA